MFQAFGSLMSVLEITAVCIAINFIALNEVKLKNWPLAYHEGDVSSDLRYTMPLAAHECLSNLSIKTRGFRQVYRDLHRSKSICNPQADKVQAKMMALPFQIVRQSPFYILGNYECLK